MARCAVLALAAGAAAEALNATVSPGWAGPFPAFYSDADCPNLGCFGKSEDWPFWIPAGTKPTVAICQQMCDYCDGTNPGNCPKGCNAFNGGDGGCCLRLCSPTALLNPTGGAGVSYRRIDQTPPPGPAPPTPAGGRCVGQNPAWGPPSACISGNPPTNFIYHCPWESAGLVSTKKFGGCGVLGSGKPGVIYDCTSTNIAALVQLYETHQTAASPPPEWGIPSIKYTECCVKRQCMNGPDTCGAPPRD